MPYDLSSHDDDPSVTYALNASSSIVYCNRAWDRFAVENGGVGLLAHPLGTPVLQVVPDVLRPFYEGLFEAARVGGEPVHHVYECPSPTTSRTVDMCVLPPRGDGLLVVVHSTIAEAPMAVGSNLPASSYVGEDDVVTMCAHCRRTLRQCGLGEWDWVPQFVARPPRCSHGLCPACAASHYPGLAHGPHRERSRLRVLIVDDEPLVRRYLRSVLELAGYHVAEADDGSHVVDVVKVWRPDLVLTDLVMPDHEGLELIGRLHRAFPELGIIAMSGARDGLYLRLALPLGADGTLAKPIHAQPLLAEMRRVLDARLARAS